MVPQTKVYVRVLPQGSKPEDLRKLFENYGVVTECDIMNRCGFVHMQTEEQAAAAIQALNSSDFNGAVITVELGRIKERRPRPPPVTSGSRGALKNGASGGPRRGGQMGARDTPYSRDRSSGHKRGDLRGQIIGGGGYDRAIERHMWSGHYADERYSTYGSYGEDRRGFSLMHPRHDYAASSHMYPDDRGYIAPHLDRVHSMYDDRHAYDHDMMDRRGPMSSGYDRLSKSAHVGNGEMYGRRSPMHGTPASGYNRDPYGHPYAPYTPMPY